MTPNTGEKMLLINKYQVWWLPFSLEASLKRPMYFNFVSCSQYWAHVSIKCGQSCFLLCIDGADFFYQAAMSTKNRDSV